jgi:hypothetical protein
MAFDPAEWLRQMRSNSGGSKVPMGPVEALGNKPGSRKPKRGNVGRVPPVTKAGARKL